MIRDVRIEDSAAIAEIYAHYVTNANVTFEVTPPTPEEMARRIAAYTPKYPYLVLEEKGKVVGYAYASPFKSRAAYDKTTELAIYLDRDHCGKGRGTALLTALIERLKEMGFYTAIACITHPNPPSEKMVTAFGFQLVGVYPNVGYKNNTWLSIADYIYPLRTYASQD
ncbi:MAG: N-acetyltransferase [Peptococcaceae bacterium]|nr:N-acetyltransferase [Peptococcaceae bacterium]